MRKNHRKKRGFTIIELIITLSLLGFVLMVIYSLFFYAQKSLIKSETHLNINQQVNMTFLYMEKDIHSAMKPNEVTDAIRVISTTEMHVYSYDAASEKYFRIVYRINPSESTVLERGVAICEDAKPPKDNNPEYGTIHEWNTLVKGIVKKHNGKETGFSLRPVPTPVSSYEPTPTPFARRAVQITLLVDDKNSPTNEPIVYEKVLTSRTNSYP